MTETIAEKHALSPIQRRILGVLVEKAKTTPDAYPLSLNAIVTGCNQKSNRDPQMNVEEGAVEDALLALRSKGAVTEVQGTGRVPKFRHHIKEWLGVDGPEVAVTTELLLRGAQTVGDLRGRAARMAPGQLADVNALRPIMEALLTKGLVVELTPPGRGQVVTHSLYQAHEWDRLRRETTALFAPSADGSRADETGPETRAASRESAALPARAADLRDHELTELRQQLAEVREQVDRLAGEVEELRKVLYQRA